MPNLLTELVGLSSLLNEFSILVQFFQMFITACTSDEVLAQVLGDFKRISLKFIAFFFPSHWHYFYLLGAYTKFRQSNLQMTQ